MRPDRRPSSRVADRENTNAVRSASAPWALPDVEVLGGPAPLGETDPSKHTHERWPMSPVRCVCPGRDLSGLVRGPSAGRSPRETGICTRASAPCGSVTPAPARPDAFPCVDPSSSAAEVPDVGAPLSRAVLHGPMECPPVSRGVRRAAAAVGVGPMAQPTFSQFQQLLAGGSPTG